MKQYLQDPIFKIISDIVDKTGQSTFVIGGYVRDCLLNRQSSDIDFVTEGDGIQLARAIAQMLPEKPRVSVYKNFGTAMFKYQKFEIEIVGARKESYRKDSRKPIVEKGTIEEDQRRRDFTINTLAICLNKKYYGQVLDPFSGMKDLKDRLIRTPLNADITFSDDPLRMLRAIRFATQLNFKIEHNTYQAIKKNLYRINIVSKERIIQELHKIIMAEKPSYGFKLLLNTGLLKIIFPELEKLNDVEVINGKAHKNNFFHTIAVLDKLSYKSNNLWLRWAALLHDIAKPQTKQFDPEIGWTFHGHNHLGAKMIPSIFRKLCMPLNEKMRYVQKIVFLHMQPINLVEETVTDSAIRRLIFEAGNELEDILLLCEADITSKNINKVNKYLNNFKKLRQKIKEVEEKDAIRNFQPPIDGNLIMKTFNLPPCKTVGIIKNAIKDAILDGLIENNYEQAYKFMLKKAKELGLKFVGKNQNKLK